MHLHTHGQPFNCIHPLTHILSRRVKPDFISQVDKEIYMFPNNIIPKMNVLGRLEFELAYKDVAVQHVSPYSMVTSLYTRRVIKVTNNL